MAEPLRHRQTKEAATDMLSLQPPRHIPTRSKCEMLAASGGFLLWPQQRTSLDTVGMSHRSSAVLRRSRWMCRAGTVRAQSRLSTRDLKAALTSDVGRGSLPQFRWVIHRRTVRSRGKIDQASRCRSRIVSSRRTANDHLSPRRQPPPFSRSLPFLRAAAGLIVDDRRLW